MSVQRGVYYSPDGRWWWDGAAWQPATPAPQIEQSGPRPSPAVCLVAFPQKLLAGVRGWQGWGTSAVPCTGFQVATEHLAEILLAASVLHLRHLGSLALAPRESRTLWLPASTELDATRTGDQAGGRLEERLLEAARFESRLHRALYRACSRDRNPYARVVAAVHDEAAEWGIFHPRTTSALWGLSRTTTYEPVCEMIALVEPAADAVAARMNEFRTQEAELYRLLMQSITKALRKLRIQDNSSLGGSITTD